MAVSDDDVIKRKLLIEGDGGNDDRRISSLLKQFIKWSGSSDDDDCNAAYLKHLGTLAQCEAAIEKTQQVHDMNLKEQEHYEKLNSDIEQQILDAYEKIQECKIELQKAKRIRRNRQEYDALAKVIQQHPDRQETLRKLDVLDKELETCKETQLSLERKLELRKKQFHVLITSIHGLQKILEDDQIREDNAMDVN